MEKYTVSIKKDKAIKTLNNDHKYYIDFLRTFGCLSVIFIHISGNFNNDIIKFNTKTYFIVQFLRVIALTAVPLFIIISGSLNLGRGTTEQKVKTKSLNLLRLFIIWLLIPLPIFISLNPQLNFSWKTIQFIIENISLYSYHLWYLIMLIGLYLLIPIFNKLVSNKKILEYLLKLYFVILIFLTINDVLSVFNLLKMNIYFADIRLLFPIFTGYFLLGYYIDHYKIKINTKNQLILVILLIALICFISIILPIMTNKDIKFDYRNTAIYFVLTPAIFLFTKEKLNMKSIIISNISNNSLGIYLIHLIFVNLFYFNFLKNISIHPLIIIPISSIIILLLSHFTVVVFKKIPLLKYLFY